MRDKLIIAKKIGISTIILVILLVAISHSTPNETTTTPKAAIKNVQDSYKTDTLTNVGQTAITQTGNQAIEMACNDGSSQACSTTQSTVATSSAIYSIVLVLLFVFGIIAFVKWGIAAIGSVISIFN